MSRTALVTPETSESPRRPSTAPPDAPARQSAGSTLHAPHLAATAVVLVGFVVTAALAVGTESLHNSNETRLLRQRVREAGAVVTAAVPSLQTPLASAAVLAEATNANQASLRRLLTPLAAKGGPFASLSVWPAQPALGAGPVVVVGGQPELASEPSQSVQRLFEAATQRGGMTINDLLAEPDRRVGYAYSIGGRNARFVVYAESELPKDRRAAVDKDSAFADLGYALYLGTSVNRQKLLASSTGGALLGGRTASTTVPFANSKLLIEMSAETELGGTLLARLPWALGALGLILSLAAAALVERLLRRRDHAESLARQNAALFAEQRSVAQTLQHSLLPHTLPQVAALSIATRYLAGVEGIDIGGDWYDAMMLENDTLLFVVGDVSGRGLRAATTMAELRYAIRAYGVQGDSPAEILTKVTRLIDVERDGQFATVLCGKIDIAGHRVTLANAGLPDPLAVSSNEAWYLTTNIGPPIGVAGSSSYSEVTLTIPPGATLLAYTDGLIERRGEDLQIGRERLKSASLVSHGTLEDLLDYVLDRTTAAQATDDTAILGVRWDS